MMSSKCLPTCFIQGLSRVAVCCTCMYIMVLLTFGDSNEDHKWLCTVGFCSLDLDYNLHTIRSNFFRCGQSVSRQGRQRP